MCSTCWSNFHPFRMLRASLNICCTTNCHNANDVRLPRYEHFPSELIQCITIYCIICSAIYCYFISCNQCVNWGGPSNLEIVVSKVTFTFFYRTRSGWNCKKCKNVVGLKHEVLKPNLDETKDLYGSYDFYEHHIPYLFSLFYQLRL